MKDEIKEILDSVKLEVNSTKSWIEPVGLNRDVWNKLLDYITNLQEENEEANDSITWWTNRFNAVQRDYEDYKSRCEKAIEYCKYNDNSLYTFEPDYDYEENIVDNYEPSNFREELLQILEGVGKDE